MSKYTLSKTAKNHFVKIIVKTTYGNYLWIKTEIVLFKKFKCGETDITDFFLILSIIVWVLNILFQGLYVFSFTF
jgi:hypothetical protein